MLHLTNVIDRATGYVYVPPSNQAPEGTVNAAGADQSSRSHRPNVDALFSTAAGPIKGLRSDVRDVQERWIDAKEEWDAFERREWRREGEMVRDAKAGEEAARKEAEQNSQPSSERQNGSTNEGSGRIKSKVRIR